MTTLSLLADEIPQARSHSGHQAGGGWEVGMSGGGREPAFTTEGPRSGFFSFTQNTSQSIQGL